LGIGGERRHVEGESDEKSDQTAQHGSLLRSRTYGAFYTSRSTEGNYIAPLRSIQGFAQMLLEEYSERLDGAAHDYAQRIVTAAHRMDALTHDLLTHSHLGHAAMAIEPVSLEAVVDDVLTQLETEIRNTAAHVAVDRPLPQVMGSWATIRLSYRGSPIS
jgi:light-regulated signal transduction histidine kinase (bacteriophytochrome)